MVSPRWSAALRRRCLSPEPEEGRAPIPPGARKALGEFRSLGSRRLQPLSWEEAWERVDRARILLAGSWHPLALQAECAGTLASRLARRGRRILLALGMVRAGALKKGRKPRGLPEGFLPALFRGLERTPSGRGEVRVLGLGERDEGLGEYASLVEALFSRVRGEEKVLLFHGELHLLPRFLPSALAERVPSREIQVLWPGAPGPFLRLSRKGDPRRPALLERGDLYLPLCHPIHRNASLRAWREKAPLLPPTRWMPWLPREPGLPESFQELAGRVAKVLGLAPVGPLPVVTFEEEDPLSLLEERVPPGPARDMAEKALEEGEGLALPHLPLLVLGGPGAVEAAEEAAHLLHLERTGLHLVPQESTLHGILLAALAEGVARAAARLALPGSPPWDPAPGLLPERAKAWKRRAWRRLLSGGANLPSPGDLSPSQAGAAAHLLGYALAERLLAGEKALSRLRRLAARTPPATAEGAASLLRGFLGEEKA